MHFDLAMTLLHMKMWYILRVNRTDLASNVSCATIVTNIIMLP